MTCTKKINRTVEGDQRLGKLFQQFQPTMRRSLVSVRDAGVKSISSLHNCTPVLTADHSD